MRLGSFSFCQIQTVCILRVRIPFSPSFGCLLRFFFLFSERGALDCGTATKLALTFSSRRGSALSKRFLLPRLLQNATAFRFLAFEPPYAPGGRPSFVNL